MDVGLDRFKDKKVLITGGLGFIGSNLALRLVEAGAQVTVLDAMVEGHGGNLFNVAPVKDDIRINFSDIRDDVSLGYLVRDQEYIFHLAGQNDHTLSLTNPFPDIDINIKGTAVLLESCRRHNPEARLVYSGTRGEYGASVTLPVNEETPLSPKGIYELSSLTAQKLFQIYHDNNGIQSIALRLTNIYGQRAQMRHHRFGVANWFIRLALDDETIKVFGDGTIIRDFVHVDDAVDAILKVSLCDAAYGQVFNVGNDTPSSFLELAETIVDCAGSGRWELAPFSRERLKQEPGDFYSDISKIRAMVNWHPQLGLRDGLARTIAYYRENKAHYWDS